MTLCRSGLDYFADSHGGCDSDFNGSRRTNFYFAEFSLPLMDNKAGKLEVDLSLKMDYVNIDFSDPGRYRGWTIRSISVARVN